MHVVNPAILEAVGQCRECCAHTPGTHLKTILT